MTTVYDTAHAAASRAAASDNVALVIREAIASKIPHIDDDGREQLLAALDDVRLRVRSEGRMDVADAIADVMDFVVGWCSPHVRL